MYVHSYSYRVMWSEEDQEFVGLCLEFPLLSWLAPTREEALSDIRVLVSDVAADMESNFEAAPVPVADSG